MLVLSGPLDFKILKELIISIKVRHFQIQTLRIQILLQFQFSALLPLSKMKISAMKRISLNTIDAVHLVQIKDILYCKCKNSSTTFYLTNHDPIVVSRSIKKVANQLGQSNFFRSHQSFLVNISHIIELNKAENYSLILSDNSHIPTSIRKRKEILQILLKK